MIPHKTAMEVKPDMEMQVGGTHIKVFGPVGVSEEEMKRRQDEFIKQAAKCLLSSTRDKQT